MAVNNPFNKDIKQKSDKPQTSQGSTMKVLEGGELDCFICGTASFGNPKLQLPCCHQSMCKACINKTKPVTDENGNPMAGLHVCLHCRAPFDKSLCTEDAVSFLMDEKNRQVEFLWTLISAREKNLSNLEQETSNILAKTKEENKKAKEQSEIWLDIKNSILETERKAHDKTKKSLDSGKKKRELKDLNRELQQSRKDEEERKKLREELMRLQKENLELQLKLNALKTANNRLNDLRLNPKQSPILSPVSIERGAIDHGHGANEIVAYNSLPNIQALQQNQFLKKTAMQLVYGCQEKEWEYGVKIKFSTKKGLGNIKLSADNINELCIALNGSALRTIYGPNFLIECCGPENKGNELLFQKITDDNTTYKINDAKATVIEIITVNAKAPSFNIIDRPFAMLPYRWELKHKPSDLDITSIKKEEMEVTTPAATASTDQPNANSSNDNETPPLLPDSPTGESISINHKKIATAKEVSPVNKEKINPKRVTFQQFLNVKGYSNEAIHYKIAQEFMGKIITEEKQWDNGVELFFSTRKDAMGDIELDKENLDSIAFACTELFNLTWGVGLQIRGCQSTANNSYFFGTKIDEYKRKLLSSKPMRVEVVIDQRRCSMYVLSSSPTAPIITGIAASINKTIADNPKPNTSHSIAAGNAHHDNTVPEKPKMANKGLREKMLFIKKLVPMLESNMHNDEWENIVLLKFRPEVLKSNPEQELPDFELDEKDISIISSILPKELSIMAPKGKDEASFALDKRENAFAIKKTQTLVYKDTEKRKVGYIKKELLTTLELICISPLTIRVVNRPLHPNLPHEIREVKTDKEIITTTAAAKQASKASRSGY